MTKKEILNLKIGSSDFDKDLTIAGYLRSLLITLWVEEENFSGKRPFGNSGWQYDVYVPLMKAGLISGSLDEDGCIDRIDYKEADGVVLSLIDSIFGKK